MAKRKLIGLFVGVPDDMLRSIGLIVVMAAGLDDQRMMLLEVAASVPAATSAKYQRKQLTQELKTAFSAAPLDQLADRVTAWLDEVNSLFDIRDKISHSTAYYETRGDGTTGFYAHHPSSGQTRLQFTADKLDEFILRFSDASCEGTRLQLDAGLLVNEGSAAYQVYLDQRAAYEASVRELLEPGAAE